MALICVTGSEIVDIVLCFHTWVYSASFQRETQFVLRKQTVVKGWTISYLALPELDGTCGCDVIVYDYKEINMI